MDLLKPFTRLKKSTLIFSAINVIGGGIIFLFLVSTADFAISEERDNYDFGDSLNFLIVVVGGVVFRLSEGGGVTAEILHENRGACGRCSSSVSL